MIITTIVKARPINNQNHYSCYTQEHDYYYSTNHHYKPSPILAIIVINNVMDPDSTVIKISIRR